MAFSKIDRKDDSLLLQIKTGSGYKTVIERTINTYCGRRLKSKQGLKKTTDSFTIDHLALNNDHLWEYLVLDVDKATSLHT